MRSIIFILFLLITFAGPAWVLLSGQVNLHGDYRTANRDSAHLAPDPNTTPEAIVQVYTARAFFWDGIFAMHTWIATKPAHAAHFTTYQVIGWRALRGLNPLFIHEDLPDRNWFDHKPIILMDVRGKAAETLIPEIDRAAKAYPYPDRYTTWPGPNSNTFTAHVLRQVPDMQIELPANAIGKDYFGKTTFFAPAISHTGYQFSLFGLLGITIAKQEGLEINLLGLVYGINPFKPSIKLPGVGELSLTKSPTSGNPNKTPLS